MADGHIVIDTRINNKTANRQLDELNGNVSKTAASISKVRGAFAKFGSALKIGGLGTGVLFAKAFETSSRLVGVLGRGTGALSKFGGRMKDILSGALLFNVISKGVTAVTEDFGTALSQCDAFRQGMANLKGAAAVATAPLVQALAPALGAVANGAAMALHYVAQLVAFFTGGSVKGFAAAAKSMNAFAGGAAKAKRSLAGFDQINKLGDSSGGGSGGAGDILPNFDFSGTSPFLEAVKTAIQNSDWAGVGSIFATKLNDILAGLDSGALGSRFGAVLGAAILMGGSFLATLDWAQLSSSWSACAIGFLTTLAGSIAAADWNAVGLGMAAGIASIDYTGLSFALGTLFGAVLNGALDFFGGLLGDAFAWVQQTFLVGWNDAMNHPERYEEAGMQIMAGLIQGILSVIVGIGKWVWKNIFVPFGTAIADAFDMHSPSKEGEGWGENIILGLYNGVAAAISNKAASIKESLVSAFKSAVNGAIDVVNTFIGWLNNALSFEWNGLSIGGKQVFGGGRIQLANLPTIPYLAQGAVIPPNREFLAVLGDQKSGTNIEAPLETIQQALANVLAAQGGGDVNVNITFTGDLAQLGRVLKPVIDKEDKRRGAPLVKGVIMV